jgi:hypothetical protein
MFDEIINYRINCKKLSQPSLVWRKISAHVDGGRAEGLACADPGERTPIGMSGFKKKLFIVPVLVPCNYLLQNFVIHHQDEKSLSLKEVILLARNRFV